MSAFNNYKESVPPNFVYTPETIGNESVPESSCGISYTAPTSPRLGCSAQVNLPVLVLEFQFLHNLLLNGRQTFFPPHLVAKIDNHETLLVVVDANPVLLQARFQVSTFGIILHKRLAAGAKYFLQPWHSQV